MKVIRNLSIKGIDSVHVGTALLTMNPNHTKGYFTGWFRDTLILNCKTLISKGESDVFVLEYTPVTIIDTVNCYPIKAISGKYNIDSSGNYFDTLYTADSHCDSVLLIRVDIRNSTSKIDTSVCWKYKTPSGKFIYSKTGQYVDTLKGNVKGCDSIIFINLKVLSTSDTITMLRCGNYQSPSSKYIYSVSGMFSDTIPNQKGCDSVIVIHFIQLKNGDSLTIFSCNPYQSPSGKYIYNSTGIYHDTLSNINLCDSIIKIAFNYLQNGDSIKINSCIAIMSPSGKYQLTSSGNYIDTIQNINHCDSIIFIEFSMNGSKDSIGIVGCSVMKSPSGKFIYSQSGIYFDTIQNVNHCDSVIQINFTNNQTQSSINIDTCFVYFSPSGKFIYNSTGTYIDTLKNGLGCDSIITINLIISKPEVVANVSNEIDCAHPEAVLTASGTLNYVWTPSDSLSTPFASETRARPSITTEYFVTGTDALGCISKDSIKLQVNPRKEMESIPNVFTPNNDGYNDCFVIPPNNELVEVQWWIYNRWGELMFTSTKVTDCWNGNTSNAENASNGVYFVLISGFNQCSQTHFVYNGSVTLLR
jgi:gliding motility-associated-like protein